MERLSCKCILYWLLKAEWKYGTKKCATQVKLSSGLLYGSNNISSRLYLPNFKKFIVAKRSSEH